MAEVIVALDYTTGKEALGLVDVLGSAGDFYKVGLELFSREGPEVVKALTKRDKRVFLDLKFHDIPTTVAKAVMEATQYGIFMLTVHAMGGKDMMERAVEAAEEAAEQLALVRPKIVAVTVPTSRQDVGEIGITGSVPDTVVRLARLAQEAGCDGVVCSPREIKMVREACGSDFLLVTPGIRMGDEEDDDQRRVDTPKAAFEAGANYIVVGRPILRASDPVVAVQKINASIHGLDPSMVKEPTPEPEPEAEPAAEESAPVEAAPEPTPEAKPSPEPAPEVSPEPVPEVAPEPVPEPEAAPEPAPEAAPEPTTEPEPEAPAGEETSPADES